MHTHAQIRQHTYNDCMAHRTDCFKAQPSYMYIFCRWNSLSFFHFIFSLCLSAKIVTVFLFVCFFVFFWMKQNDWMRHNVCVNIIVMVNNILNYLQIHSNAIRIEEDKWKQSEGWKEGQKEMHYRPRDLELQRSGALCCLYRDIEKSLESGWCD